MQPLRPLRRARLALACLLPASVWRGTGWISMLAGLVLVGWRRMRRLKPRRVPDSSNPAAAHAADRHAPQRLPAGYATLFGNPHE
jgi:hypothetical protein